MKAKYFIRNNIKRGDIKVENCPTEMMWLDILNKTKQGKTFCLFRGEFMNFPEDCDYKVEQINTHRYLLT